MSKTAIVVLGVGALLLLALLSGAGWTPLWGLEAGAGILGGLASAVVGVIAGIGALLLAGIVLVAVAPVVVIAVLVALLVAGVAVLAVLLLGLAPLLIPVLLVVGLVWLIARAARSDERALPPPAPPQHNA